MPNPDLACFLALDTDLSPEAARQIAEVMAISKETGKMERGRPGFGAFAKRRAADLILGIREGVEREVDALLELMD